MRVKVFQDVLAANERLAEMNRKVLNEHRILAFNLIGSPGCGKTTFLEKSLAMLIERGRARPGVIEGDLATSRDAERVARCGVPVIQINTQGGCHLDAAMVQGVLHELPLDRMNLLFIENVGNLVCPAEYDLGEHYKTILLSTAEGDDKPAKYPSTFHTAQAAIITKLDLLPHTDFSLDAALQDMRAANPRITVFRTSARTGDGMLEWVEWIESLLRA